MAQVQTAEEIIKRYPEGYLHAADYGPWKLTRLACVENPKCIELIFKRLQGVRLELSCHILQTAYVHILSYCHFTSHADPISNPHMCTFYLK